MSLLNVANIVECTEVEGPGRRLALWVQGCMKRCVGCCNPELLKIKPQNIVDSEVIFELISHASARYNIEGITLLGGEPFIQAKGLSHLASKCKKSGLSVLVFSGYTLDELYQIKPEGYESLLVNTDVLIDGPYNQSLPDNTRRWVGSQNQVIHYLTDRYSAKDFEMGDSELDEHEIEVRIGETLKINGWPVKVRY